MSEHYTFRVDFGGQTKILTEKELADRAAEMGLDRITPNRYSWLFVGELLWHKWVDNVDLSMIVEEIKALEGLGPSTETRPPSQFKRPPLKGLWHKHFFAAQFVAHNIRNELTDSRLRALVEEVCDPARSATSTPEKIRELCHRVITEPFEARAATGRLTGEWIVYANHGGMNYYLSLAGHKTGGQVIHDRIKASCLRQFPFLKQDLQL